MPARVSAVVCDWCNRTVKAAPPGSPVTHTICRTCADWTFTHQPLAFGVTTLEDVDYIDLPPRNGDGVTNH